MRRTSNFLNFGLAGGGIEDASCARHIQQSAQLWPSNRRQAFVKHSHEGTNQYKVAARDQQLLPPIGNHPALCSVACMGSGTAGAQLELDT